MKSTLIICALPEELHAVEGKLLSGHERIEINSQLNLSINRFNSKNGPVYTVLSGMGPINASLRLSLVLSSLSIDEVFLLGVAGGLTGKTKIGDLVVSEAVIQHDYYSSLEDGDYLMKSGDLILSSAQASGYSPLIKASGDLVKICQKTELEKNNIYSGVIASGSEFVGRGERKIKISKLESNLLAVDMEACAIANVCEQFKIPFVVAKTISDTLHTDGTIGSDFATFLKFASENAAKVVERIIN